MRRFILALTLTVGVWPGSAQAAPIFFDNFDAENGGLGVLNYGGLQNFTVTDGVVDLIGVSLWDPLPGNGLYLDLDGTGTDSGIVTANPLALGPGTYQLSFDLGGSQRGSDESVNIRVFGGNNSNYASLDIFKSSSDPFAPVLIQFALLAPDGIQFAFNNAGGDNIGALLDNVAVDDLNPPIHTPEPGSLILLGTGMLLAGRKFRRRRTAN